MIFLLIVIGPVSLLGVALLDNVQTYSADFVAGRISVPPPGDSVKDWPVVGEKLYQFWSLASVNLEAALVRIGPELTTVGSALMSAVAGTSLGILKFIVSVIIAGCLLVPAVRLTSGFKSFANRISAERGEPFVDLAAATIRNVARGVIGVSMLQSLLIGIGLLAAGVPGAGLITFGALFLGIIQIGPGLLVIASIIWAWAELSTVWALVFTAYMVPAMVLDNFLKPIVMARGLSTPMLVIFIGVIGGTMTHGIIGLFIGPIVLAVAYEVVAFWVREQRVDEPTGQSNDVGGPDQPLTHQEGNS